MGEHPGLRRALERLSGYQVQVDLQEWADGTTAEADDDDPDR